MPVELFKRIFTCVFWGFIVINLRKWRWSKAQNPTLPVCVERKSSTSSILFIIWHVECADRMKSFLRFHFSLDWWNFHDIKFTHAEFLARKMFKDFRFSDLIFEFFWLFIIFVEFHFENVYFSLATPTPARLSWEHFDPRFWLPEICRILIRQNANFCTGKIHRKLFF